MTEASANLVFANASMKDCAMTLVRGIIKRGYKGDLPEAIELCRRLLCITVEDILCVGHDFDMNRIHTLIIRSHFGPR